MAGELILIVEDNEKNMKLVRDILQFKGYRTLEAGTAHDAIALATEHLPDLILMDIQLPDMDGDKALAKLRGEPATAALRVVALTAFAMRDDRERFLALGFDDYLTKPIDVRQFPEFIRQQCELGRRGE
ncbi:MAG: response regulator [Chloroflexota bacterium]|nr:response regulator [Chloroflexota bacterium]